MNDLRTTFALIYNYQKRMLGVINIMYICMCALHISVSVARQAKADAPKLSALFHGPMKKTLSRTI